LEISGKQIGPYKLLQKIGEGGFGMVYMAEQKTPVRRRVALKVVKLGMDTRAVVARFEAERQALALMDHPNIARVLDAGATPTGRPYFVMELVKGIKITNYCDQNCLSTRERLELFVQVCRAVRHAHQRGIIHRDLKPSNILVTLHDGIPVPKVIDFGIAKATAGQELTDKTLFTAFEQFMGTPAYMSPEQAEFSGLDVDTRSDIYSLGVLLYELLTSTTPFEHQRLVKAGIDEMRRIIKEEEPPRPSTRLSTMTGEQRTSVAKVRHSEPPKLLGTIRGDLDWIVMRTLEKDRRRRYESTEALVADIQRHLHHEPVLACPPRFGYRLWKLFKRRKLALSTAAIITGALLLSTLFYLRERVARAKADEQSTTTKAVAQFFARDVLGQADVRRQVEVGYRANPDLTVREALERASQRIEGRFDRQPRIEAGIRLAVGDALAGLGEYAQALPHMRQAVSLYRSQLGPNHPDTIIALNNLAGVHNKAGNADQAVPLYEEALRLTRNASSDPVTLVGLLNNLAATYLIDGRFTEAAGLWEEALQTERRRGATNQESALKIMNNLARASEAAGRFEEAESLSRETLKLRQQHQKETHPDTLNAMGNLGWSCLLGGKDDEALLWLEKTLELRKSSLVAEHPDTLKSMHNLGRAHLDAGRLAQAESLLRDTLELRYRKLRAGHPDTLLTMSTLGKCLLRQQQFSQAEPLLRDCFESRKKNSTNDWRTFESQTLLGMALNGQGKYPEAESLLCGGYTGLKAQEQKIPVPDKTALAAAARELVELYKTLGQTKETEQWKTELQWARSRQKAVPPSAGAKRDGQALGRPPDPPAEPAGMKQNTDPRLSDNTHK
jgi:serine/threonine protein kinase/tetratricopeptide (TPR) repeat protein